MEKADTGRWTHLLSEACTFLSVGPEQGPDQMALEKGLQCIDGAGVLFQAIEIHCEQKGPKSQP